MRSVLHRTVAILLPAFCLLTGTSLVPVDEFVTSGEYERAFAMAADCRVSYFPALDERDREPLRFAYFISYMPAGRDLRYRYRPLDTSVGMVRSDQDDYEWVDKGESRWEIYEADDSSMVMGAASEIMADGSCRRLYMKAVPPVLQVGLRESTIKTSTSFLNNFGDLLPKGYNSTVTLEAVPPGEGEIVVKYYEDGAPMPNAFVYLSTDARGLPGRYGSTLGHEHLAKDAGRIDPSIRIRGQRQLGEGVQVKTDGEGEARFWVRAGYRGGAEVVMARTADYKGFPGMARSLSIVVRHKEFKHFLFALGHTKQPVPGEDFPFILTGWTDRHYYPHFIDASRAHQIASAFQTIWAQDSARAASPTPRYIVLNDMSLEYGGAFKLGSGNACMDPSHGSHATHDRGIDFDVSPCYSTGEDGRQKVFAADCESGNHLKINERLLAAHVIGRFGGAILVHSPKSDGAPYHYHIRFPSE